jgi:hypothetical protein
MKANNNNTAQFISFSTDDRFDGARREFLTNLVSMPVKTTTATTHFVFFSILPRSKTEEKEIKKEREMRRKKERNEETKIEREGKRGRNEKREGKR